MSEDLQGEIVEALARRSTELNAETSRVAQDLLTRAGEKPTAQFLTMHGRLNEIIEETELSDPREKEKYIEALFEVFSQMADSLNTGDNAKTLERQRRIANAGSGEHSLAQAVRTAIREVGGSAGPLETRLSSDTRL